VLTSSTIMLAHMPDAMADALRESVATKHDLEILKRDLTIAGAAPH
jgi:hypothetical protein